MGPNTPPEDRPIDFQLATQVLALQAQELEHRKAELAVRGHELDQGERESQRAHEYALRALDLKERETQHHVRLFSGMNLRRDVLLLVVVVMMGGLAFTALREGQAALVEKAMTHLVALGGGIGLGYAWKGNKDSKKRDEDDESNG